MAPQFIALALSNQKFIGGFSGVFNQIILLRQLHDLCEPLVALAAPCFDHRPHLAPADGHELNCIAGSMELTYLPAITLSVE
jgi:hypothetical protein